MALVIQTNNAAVTAQKNINTNNMAQNKALNRLSSGFRINSAADDSAGFAISSKLDAQGSRLKAAVQNTAQAASLVKTAEAGVNEIQNMIVRLQSLAVQAASANNAGSLTQLDAERSKLTTEIDKIANSTNYNGTNLLNGIDANSAAVNGTAATVGTTVTANAGNTGNGTFAVSNAGSANFSVPSTATFTATMTGATAFTVKSDVDLTNVTTGAVITAGTALTTANTGLTFTFTAGGTADVSGDSYTFATTANGSAYTAGGSAAYTAALAFQVGGENNANDQVSVNLQHKYTTAGLGITGDLTSATNAQSYIDTLKSSLDTLITQRADLGATANQLGFVSANLATSIEQTTASVSTIRDANIAAEMANFTKSQILVQAGTAMLAQANQTSQNVLRLFR